MKYAILTLFTLVLLTSCAEPTAEAGLKAIVGGRLEVSLDAEPIPYSVIVIGGGKIRSVGPQASTPVPKGAETINAKGKLIRPMPYDATIVAGQPANFILLNAETGAPDSIMQSGEWVR
ncbi:MAG: hypothetical protein ABI811_15460 [Acidobacteriota bacterium]